MTNFDWNWLWGPVVGAVIGLITNGIAIRMLFRPFYPVKIGNFTLPFTPGLIPKEKARIARSIGVVVSDNLVNVEVLRRGLINEAVNQKLSDAVEGLVANGENSEHTIGQKLNMLFGVGRVTGLTKTTEEKITDYVYKRAVSLDLGNNAIDMIQKEFERQASEEPDVPNFNITPFILGMVGPRIAEKINAAVEGQGRQVIGSFIDSEATQLLAIPLKDIAANSREYVPVMQEWLIHTYEKVVEEALPKVLAQINIAGLVEEQINKFSVQELEKMLVDLMHKELGAIIYLGGLLGFVMGIIMNFMP